MSANRIDVADRGHLWHALGAAEVARAVGADLPRGLDREEAARRLARVGRNVLPEAKRRSLLVVFLRQFASPLIYLLIIAAVVAVALGERTDAIVISLVVLANAIVGAAQEGSAERAMAALRRLASDKAHVLRGGHEVVVEAGDVVPGDLLVLGAGNAVAADARLVDGAAVQMAESALTGESVPVAKDARPLAPDTVLADRRNMVYAGTHVTAGRARAVVVATGLSTEIGRIAAMAEAATEPKTPLERRIDKFGRYVIVAAIAVFMVVIGLGLLRGIGF
jgi:Ca2+-transporting ATPase